MLAAWVVLSVMTIALQAYVTGAGLDFPESPVYGASDISYFLATFPFM